MAPWGLPGPRNLTCGRETPRAAPARLTGTLGLGGIPAAQPGPGKAGASNAVKDTGPHSRPANLVPCRPETPPGRGAGLLQAVRPGWAQVSPCSGASRVCRRGCDPGSGEGRRYVRTVYPGLGAAQTLQECGHVVFPYNALCQAGHADRKNDSFSLSVLPTAPCSAGCKMGRGRGSHPCRQTRTVPGPASDLPLGSLIWGQLLKDCVFASPQGQGDTITHTTARKPWRRQSRQVRDTHSPVLVVRVTLWLRSWRPAAPGNWPQWPTARRRRDSRSRRRWGPTGSLRPSHRGLGAPSAGGWASRWAEQRAKEAPLVPSRPAGRPYIIAASGPPL